MGSVSGVNNQGRIAVSSPENGRQNQAGNQEGQVSKKRAGLGAKIYSLLGCLNPIKRGSPNPNEVVPTESIGKSTVRPNFALPPLKPHMLEAELVSTCTDRAAINKPNKQEWRGMNTNDIVRAYGYKVSDPAVDPSKPIFDRDDNPIVFSWGLPSAPEKDLTQQNLDRSMNDEVYFMRLLSTEGSQLKDHWMTVGEKTFTQETIEFLQEFGRAINVGDTTGAQEYPTIDLYINRAKAVVLEELKSGKNSSLETFKTIAKKYIEPDANYGFGFGFESDEADLKPTLNVSWEERSLVVDGFKELKDLKGDSSIEKAIDDIFTGYGKIVGTIYSTFVKNVKTDHGNIPKDDVSL
ncbi:hypothetical protein ACJJI4_09560 [Microbulbifer sp. TRSA002]|uniref:hypothetical protein n=1 Tax=Microbulbifer sp. TRSA002 TaxID=3243382 RepID=UPI00403954DF